MCTHTCPSGGAGTQPGPVSSAGWCQGVGTSGPSNMCTHSLVCRVWGRGGWLAASAPCPVLVLHIHRPRAAAGLGVSGFWGPAGGQDRFPEAPTGFPSPGPREKRPQRGSLCVDALITSPTSPPPGRPPLGEALLGTPSRTKRPPGRAAELAERLLLPAAAGGRFQPPAPGAAAGLREEGARAGRRRGRG